MTGNVIASATMSLDGFVAYENNDPGALFDWYDAGDVEVANAGTLPPFHLTRESADYWTEWTSKVGCLVVGLHAVRHHGRLDRRASDGRAVRGADP